jgi:hypothetical protein
MPGTVAHITLEDSLCPNADALAVPRAQCVASHDECWEHTWRPEIQHVVGSAVLDNFWGKVCKIRDCILHNEARANADYEKRAKGLK